MSGTTTSRMRSTLVWGGDRTEHVLRRVRNTRIGPNIKFVIIHCGTNNVDFHRPVDIAEALISIGEKALLYNPEINVIISGILPRGSNYIRSEKVLKTNCYLKKSCQSHKKNIHYLEHDPDWTNKDGSIDQSLFYKDQLHLIRPGNIKLAEEIDRAIKQIRNDIGVVDNPLHSPLGTHTHTFPIGKSRHSGVPKWEKCEYVCPSTISSPLPPLPLSSSSPLPFQCSRSFSPTSSSVPPNGCSGDGVDACGGGCGDGGGYDDDEGSDGSHSSSPPSPPSPPCQPPQQPPSSQPSFLSSISLSFLLLLIYFKNFLNTSCKILSNICNLLISIHFLLCNSIIFLSYTIFYLIFNFLTYSLIYFSYTIFYLIYKFLAYGLILLIFINLSYTLYGSNSNCSEFEHSQIYVNNKTYEGSFYANSIFNVFNHYTVTSDGDHNFFPNDLIHCFQWEVCHLIIIIGITVCF